MGVATTMAPLLKALVGDMPVRVAFWDGTQFGQGEHTLAVRSPEAIKRLLWAPGELGLGRAYVCGEIDFDGDVVELLHALRPAGPRVRNPLRLAPAAVAVAAKLGVVGKPPEPPEEEVRPRGVLHSKERDAQAVSHHYDVGNDFYRLVLGPAMTYSCARFATPDMSLEDAQAAKHDLVCRKLGLNADSRLLDVGCGWGSMAMHAASRYGAGVVGVTISREQADLARRRVKEARLDHLVEIRLQDYRDLRHETFDAISSIGMFEHVGKARMQEYFTTLRSLLKPRGRLLNHAISAVGDSQLSRRSFVYRYVFPDAELVDVGNVVLAMQAAGFEVRDVESLREHYARTLRHWVANLEADWDEAVALVGERRARVWRLYMAGSAVGFADGGLNVHQALGVVPDPAGASGMPPTRREWG